MNQGEPCKVGSSKLGSNNKPGSNKFDVGVGHGSND